MNELATIRASVQKLTRLMEQGAGGYHEELLLSVDADAGEVRTLIQTNGRQVITFNTWNAAYFDEVTGNAEAIVPVGGSGADSRGFVDYMDFAGTGTVELTLLADDDGERASQLRAEGSLNVQTRLPASADDFDQIPYDHPIRWTPDNQYVSQSCLTDEGKLPEDEDDWIVGPSVIKTTASAIRDNIIEPADFADGTDTYPLVVENGEFRVDVTGDQHDDQIWGEVNAELVEGPDIERAFRPGFSEVFNTLDGVVRLQTAPMSGDVPPPLTVVQDDKSDRVYRHLLGAVGE